MKNNPFLKSSNRTNYLETDMTHKKNNFNSFKDKKHNFKQELKETPEFTILDEMFPTLTSIVTKETKTHNFKEALEHQTNKNDVTDTLSPGWIKLHKYMSETSLQSPSEPTMEQIISAAQKKWHIHRVNYDKLHGDGAYDELHYMPPSYDINIDYNSDDDSIEMDSYTDDTDDYIINDDNY